MPTGDYTVPLGKARVVQSGTDVTLVGYGAQMRPLQAAANRAQSELGVSVELIDLRTILPWDVGTRCCLFRVLRACVFVCVLRLIARAECVAESVRKTGRLIVSHEAQQTGGFAAEIVSTITERCFLHLEAPPLRVCGYAQNKVFALQLDSHFV